MSQLVESFLIFVFSINIPIRHAFETDLFSDTDIKINLNMFINCLCIFNGRIN